MKKKTDYKVVAHTIPNRQKQFLDDLAGELGINRSDLLRRIIDEKIQQIAEARALVNMGGRNAI